MSSTGLLTAAVLIACLAFSAAAQGPKSFKTQESGDPLGGEWMNIPDPEHTDEYLQRVGGAGGDPNAATGADFGGNWTFELKDRFARTMEVDLFQSGTVIFGVGKVRSADGTQALTLNGYLSDGGLYLSAVTVGINPEAVHLYRMTLTGSAQSMTGSFEGFSGVGTRWSGAVNGRAEPVRTMS